MSKERILIVEDEAIVAEELKEDLERLGYEVAGIIDTGDQVVETVAALKPDLILMDVRLKGSVDGIEAAYQTQAEFDIPVIYLSAYSDVETLERAALTTPAAYLIKPFNERELAANIALALSSVRSRLSSLEKLRGNEPLVDVLDVPALLLDSLGLIVYANRPALSYLRVRDRSFIRNESITRFVDVGTREAPERPCLIVAADGSTGSAVVRMESLTLSNGEQIGALVTFHKMSDKERDFLETSACALNDALIANLPGVDAAGPGYGVGGFLLPCLSGTGDFFDVFPLGSEYFCFYALDVMGHGPLAALIAWSLRDMARTAAAGTTGASPGAILARLNQDYREKNFVPDSFFVSMILGIVERGSGRFKIARAGHPPCLHLRPSKSPELLLGTGTALGITAKLQVQELTGVMETNGRLVVFSDGTLESYSGGRDKMEAALNRIADLVDHPLDSFVDTLRTQARENFSGDDASLLAIHRYF